MKIFWKSYLTFWVVFNCVIFYVSLHDAYTEPWNYYDYLELVLWPIGMIGLFGYAFSTPIGTQIIWKILFVIIFTTEIGYLFYNTVIEWAAISELGYGMVAVIYSLGIIILTPYYLALFFYGWRSKGLWQT